MNTFSVLVELGPTCAPTNSMHFGDIKQQGFGGASDTVLLFE